MFKRQIIRSCTGWLVPLWWWIQALWFIPSCHTLPCSDKYSLVFPACLQMYFIVSNKCLSCSCKSFTAELLWSVFKDVCLQQMKVCWGWRPKTDWEVVSCLLKEAGRKKNNINAIIFYTDQQNNNASQLYFMLKGFERLVHRPCRFRGNKTCFLQLDQNSLCFTWDDFKKQ